MLESFKVKSLIFQTALGHKLITYFAEKQPLKDESPEWSKQGVTVGVENAEDDIEITEELQLCKETKES